MPTSSANTHAISTNGEMKRRLQHGGGKGKGWTQQTKGKVGEVNYVQGQKKKGGWKRSTAQHRYALGTGQTDTRELPSRNSESHEGQKESEGTDKGERKKKSS